DGAGVGDAVGATGDESVAGAARASGVAGADGGAGLRLALDAGVDGSEVGVDVARVTGLPGIPGLGDWAADRRRAGATGVARVGGRGLRRGRPRVARACDRVLGEA